MVGVRFLAKEDHLPTRCLVRPGEYHDSVALMEIARELGRHSSVKDAAVVMATDANKDILRQAGLLLPEIEAAAPNDLIIVVQAQTDDAAAHALKMAEVHLVHRSTMTAPGHVFRPRSIRGVVRTNPGVNLATISVAGQYAATEAWQALRNGLHVLLFSDNVSIEEEIALKQYARNHGLLMMGPDCGTAIINGVALGFANVVPRGPVGIVAASGPGLQEVSTLLAKLGVGIAQAIGTGGRDVKQAVGGMMMLEGLGALQSDPDTQVLVLISKSPSPVVVEQILTQVQMSTKPTVACFLGCDRASGTATGVIPAHTLQDTAYLAAEQVKGYSGSTASEVIEQESATLRTLAIDMRKSLNPGQKYLRGLFSGGTLASEAMIIWQDILGDVFSNVPLESRLKLEDSTQSKGNCAIDLGEDEFTVGLPHPMIDNDLRIRRLIREAADPEVGVLVLDTVLGHGAHPDPASELAPAIRQAREQAASEDRPLLVVASVTGTQDDPQGLDRQVQALEDAGAVVCACNAAAARLAAFIIGP